MTLAATLPLWLLAAGVSWVIWDVLSLWLWDRKPCVGVVTSCTTVTDSPSVESEGSRWRVVRDRLRCLVMGHVPALVLDRARLQLACLHCGARTGGWTLTLDEHR